MLCCTQKQIESALSPFLLFQSDPTIHGANFFSSFHSGKVRALESSFENYCVWLVRSIILHVARVTSPKLFPLPTENTLLDRIGTPDGWCSFMDCSVLHCPAKSADCCACMNIWAGRDRPSFTGLGKLSTQLLFLSWMGFAEVGRARANFDGN
jgi:hypothetical protein